MSRGKAIGAGALAGFLAGLVMTVVMLVLAWLFGVATPLVIFGDRLSVFIPADTFLKLMGRVGGYNHMKQLGVGSVMAGQMIVGAIGGAIYGLVKRRGRERKNAFGTIAIFILLPLLLWRSSFGRFLGQIIVAFRLDSRLRLRCSVCSSPLLRLSAHLFELPLPHAASDVQRQRGVESGIRATRISSQWFGNFDCRRRCGRSAQTLSRRHFQLRRHAVQRERRPANYA